jgi:transposase InsO family protein
MLNIIHHSLLAGQLPNGGAVACRALPQVIALMGCPDRRIDRLRVSLASAVLSCASHERHLHERDWEGPHPPWTSTRRRAGFGTGGTCPAWARSNRVRAMGIRDRPISPRSPWQNPYNERLIGTLRRDCLDHVLICGERHLRRVLTLYSLYYNETRTHLGLGKDAPLRRTVQRSGPIVAEPVLSGLHHRYVRI